MYYIKNKRKALLIFGGIAFLYCCIGDLIQTFLNYIVCFIHGGFHVFWPFYFRWVWFVDCKGEGMEVYESLVGAGVYIERSCNSERHHGHLQLVS